MRTILEALHGLADRLDILFYVSPNVDTSEEVTAKFERDLANEWGIVARVKFEKTARTGSSNSWTEYVLPALSLSMHPDYVPLCGPEQVKAFERSLADNPELVFVFGLSAMMPAVATREKLPPLYFDLNDIEHVKLVRNLKQPPFWLGKYTHYFRIPALMLGERRAIRRATKTFVCSDHDRDYLSNTWKLRGVATLPNAVRIPPAIDRSTSSGTILFIGSYTYAPNADAAEFLITRIWPLVRKEVPNARLLIAGNRPERIPSFTKTTEGVEFAGFVPDLDKLYEEVQVVCCPILSGGGTRLKIIEAAAHGKPVVATTIGAEGLEFSNESEILIRDAETDIARACIELLRNPGKCKEMGTKAKARATELYDRGQIISRLRLELNRSASAAS